MDKKKDNIFACRSGISIIDEFAKNFMTRESVVDDLTRFFKAISGQEFYGKTTIKWQGLKP